jgi:DNA repair protein RecO (recombination protein O)
MSGLQTTRAVVLRTVKHRDNALVLTAYTERFGTRSYLVRTGKRTGVKPAHLQPLDRLELVVTEDRDRELLTVRELRLLKPYLRVPVEPARGMLLLFAQEVLCRTLREESPDEALFAFVMHSLEQIDSGERLGQLPLFFLIRLAGHLGFLPEPPRKGEDHFDLMEGHFLRQAPDHGHYMNPRTTAAFATLLRETEEGTGALLAPEARKDLLEQLLVFFRLHVEGFGQLRSPAVLHTVLG